MQRGPADQVGQMDRAAGFWGWPVLATSPAVWPSWGCGPRGRAGLFSERRVIIRAGQERLGWLAGAARAAQSCHQSPLTEPPLYIPAHFAEADPDEVARLIDAAPLACVVAQSVDGLVANHLPLLRAPDGGLIGHVALANDLHRLIADGQEVLTIFRGEHAYVSPNYYPSKPEHHRHVPTWNYQVVHIYGPIRFQHDTQSKRAAVGLLTRLHERRLNGDKAWRMADAPADYMEQMLASIVAFRIDCQRILAKSKLSQNREPRDFAGAVEGLAADGHAGLAELMRQRMSGGID